MSTTPRVSSAIAGEPAHFGTVLAHQPAIAASFSALYGRFWGSDVLAARIKEVARMRNARVTECGFCRNVRFDKALAQGLGEEVVDDITDGYETSSRLTDTEKAVLKFTDALIHDPDLADRRCEGRLAAPPHARTDRRTGAGGDAVPRAGQGADHDGAGAGGDGPHRAAHAAVLEAADERRAAGGRAGGQSGAGRALRRFRGQGRSGARSRIAGAGPAGGGGGARHGSRARRKQPR
jgi:alkylhydroperoxidase family enzyme